MNDPIMYRVLDRLKNVPTEKWECWMQDHLYFHIILDYVSRKHADMPDESSDSRSIKLLPYLSTFNSTEEILEKYKGNTKEFLSDIFRRIPEDELKTSLEFKTTDPLWNHVTWCLKQA